MTGSRKQPAKADSSQRPIYLSSGVEIPMKKRNEKLHLGPLILVLILSIIVGAISIRVYSQIHMIEMRNHVD